MYNPTMAYRSRFLPILLVLILSAVALCRPASEEVSWVKRFDTALKQAANENKFVVIDVSATWCGPCRDMERRVFPDPEFIEFSRDNVFMLLQSDRDSEGARVARRFNVHAFPTILVLNSQGREVGRLLGSRSAGRLIRDLEEIFSRYPNPERRQVQSPKVVEPAAPRAAEPPAPPAPVKQAVASVEAKPAADPAPVQPAPSMVQNEDDPIARLEKRLASAADDSERNWLHLMLGMAHFQARHWKEAQAYLTKILEKDPQNSSAREMMKTVEKYLRP